MRPKIGNIIKELMIRIIIMNKDVAILHASVKLLIIRRIPHLPNVTKNIRRSRSNMSYVVRSRASIVRMF